MDSHGSSSDPVQKVLDRLDGFGTQFSTFSTELHSLSSNVAGLRSDVTALSKKVGSMDMDVGRLLETSARLASQSSARLASQSPCINQNSSHAHSQLCLQTLHCRNTRSQVCSNSDVQHLRGLSSICSAE